jgi:hypothetical protein
MPVEGALLEQLEVEVRGPGEDRLRPGLPDDHGEERDHVAVICCRSR